MNYMIFIKKDKYEFLILNEDESRKQNQEGLLSSYSLVVICGGWEIANCIASGLVGILTGGLKAEGEHTENFHKYVRSYK